MLESVNGKTRLRRGSQNAYRCLTLKNPPAVAGSQGVGARSDAPKAVPGNRKRTEFEPPTNALRQTVECDWHGVCAYIEGCLAAFGARTCLSARETKSA